MKVNKNKKILWVYFVILVLSVIIFPDTAVAQDICDSGCTPLMDMVQGQNYYGELGGLYGNYNNNPPAAHVTKINEAISQITPRDANGTPSASGKIVLLTIGMSNTSMKSNAMIGQAANDLEISSNIVIVNGGRGSVIAERWANNYQDVWGNYLPAKLSDAGVTSNQVQAIWMEITNFAPEGSCTVCMATGGTWVNALTQDLSLSAAEVKNRFPNAKIVFMSNRTYGGYAIVDLNDEPYAYETGIAVRRVILGQIEATNPTVSYSNAPVLVWGPSLWADDGNVNSEGLAWYSDDFVDTDKTHPVEGVPGKGAEKAAAFILAFFKTSQYTTSWFTGTQNPPPTPTPGIPGDINGDGDVNIQDYILLSNAFGTTDPDADINDDGTVNIQDYIILSNNF